MESKSQVGILLFLGAVVLLYYVGFPQQLRETAEQPQAWSTHPQGEFYGQVGGLLSSSRRNHGCLMEVNPSSGHLEAIHFAGRFGNNIEAMDMNSAFPATRLLSQPEEELLAINHIAFEYVDKLAPHSATAPHHDNSHRGGLGKEIWIMCGFWGDRTNSEVAIDNIHIIDADTWQVRKGPLLPSARGSCGSFAIAGPSDQLDWSPSNPHRHTSSSTISSSSSSSSLTSSSIIQGRMVCTVGGFLGAHNSGESIDDVDCYDRVKEEWVKLPSLPRPIDHGNAVFVPKSTCPDFKDDQVLLLNGRTGAYGSSQMEMYKLDIHAGHQWQELPFTSPTQIGAAAVALTPDGHLIVVGGIDYPPIHRRRSYKSPDIHVLDLCRGLACASRYQLDFPRWALYPCYSPVSEQLMICGGDAGLVSENEATGSVSSCRLFNVTSIVNDCHHQSAWVPSNAAHIHSQNHFPFLHHPSP